MIVKYARLSGESRQKPANTGGSKRTLPRNQIQDDADERNKEKNDWMSEDSEREVHVDLAEDMLQNLFER